MMKIKIMPDQLANQIAAGEVIERPASVVKELIENAIDAEANRIDIAIEEAGLKSIRVTDNGSGIPYEEVIDAFNRHATSKLLSQEELFRIRTLGFRGEALPSIASVSELTITTAEEGKKGKEIYLSGGKVIKESSAASRVGTMIQVEDLFFNTPARLKYVKSMKTELAHITDSINRFALAHPDIAFKLINDGMTLTRTTGNGDLRQTIAGIYGVNIAKKMKAITNENFDFQVSGYVSLPEVSRSNRSYITTIVNGRYIKNYTLARAVVNGYGSKLMVGRFPVAVINIEMDPQLLDVNVHPTKDQVRISNEQDLGTLIQEAIQKVMTQEVRIPNAIENINQNKKINNPKQTFEQEKLSFNHYSKRENMNADSSTSTLLDQNDGRNAYHERGLNQRDNNYLSMSTTDMNKNKHESLNEDPVKLARNQTLIQNYQESRDHFPEMDYIGQMHGTYLFAQNEEGLFIIDQHAAQERIKYEYFREEIASEGTALQSLLVPIVLEYPASDTLKIKEHREELEAAGITLEDFGTNTFIVKSHPSWFISGQEESTIKEMIDFLLNNKSLSNKEFREATAIMMSCKRSIKANHYLSDQEARALIEDLKRTNNPYNCPHGRPVLVQMENRDIEKMFKRIQDR
ncbi:MAG TPA: DNA mismatch repair endonuclease MutL [Alloiococcus sp.]|nr:DNA mismatch repair endonuclease MutL [Alloiococcus sp.]